MQPWMVQPATPVKWNSSLYIHFSCNHLDPMGVVSKFHLLLT